MADVLQAKNEVCERVDPRIRRTRQMLFEALESLLMHRSIEEITVADIAAQAGLNRGTLYDHYPDKFTLLEGFVESRFQHLLRERGVRFDGTCAHAITGITLATCDYLASVPQSGCPHRRVTERLLESAMTSVVRGMLLRGLKMHPPAGDLSPELMAASMAGAIYGAAREWANGHHHESAEVVAQAIFAVFRHVMMPEEPAKS